LLDEIERLIYNPLRNFTAASTWKKCVKTVNDFVYKVIQDRRKEGFQGKSDFLSTILSLEASGEIQTSDAYLRDELTSFFLAGRDTTALLLTYTHYLLAENPHVEKKMIDEIHTVLNGERADINNIKLLKYTRMVVDESLRFYPPAVPLNSKQSTKDITLPNKTKVHRGQYLRYSPYVLHRLPEYWGDDANEFIPERWEKPLKHPYQFLPFQKGPRMCLGIMMAYEEVMSCIVRLVQNGIRFSYVGKKPLKLTITAVLSLKEGLPMKVKLEEREREKSAVSEIGNSVVVS